MDDKARRGNEIERNEDNPEGETTGKARSIGYVRVSTPVSTPDSYSLLGQVALVEEFASRKGFESADEA